LSACLQAVSRDCPPPESHATEADVQSSVRLQLEMREDIIHRGAAETPTKFMKRRGK
jgi:hypothetical protein